MKVTQSFSKCHIKKTKQKHEKYFVSFLRDSKIKLLNYVMVLFKTVLEIDNRHKYRNIHKYRIVL